MSLKDWPVYVTDDGSVYCNQEPCENQHFLGILLRRRVVWSDVQDALAQHIEVEHEAKS